MTRAELITSLADAGYLAGTWGLPKDDRFQPISCDFVREALPLWVESLPVELVTTLDIGGGKTARVPRWEPESGDCDNIAADFCAYLARCVWRDAIKYGRVRGNVAAGQLFFQVDPGAPSSGHAVVWFIDHAGLAHHVDPAQLRLDHLTAEQLGTIFGGEYA